jgi:hypothetical protein
MASEAGARIEPASANLVRVVDTEGRRSWARPRISPLTGMRPSRSRQQRCARRICATLESRACDDRGGAGFEQTEKVSRAGRPALDHAALRKLGDEDRWSAAVSEDGMPTTARWSPPARRSSRAKPRWPESCIRSTQTAISGFDRDRP